MDKNLKLQLGNLHDVLLNANLQKSCMLKEPLQAEGINAFMISNRGRFERTWLGLLYVLIECWQSKQMKGVVEFIAGHVPDSEIIQLLREGKKNGEVEKLLKIRYYMFHRDQKEYFDEGRFAVAGNLEFNLKLHDEFGRVLLAAMEALEKSEGIFQS